MLALGIAAGCGESRPEARAPAAAQPRAKSVAPGPTPVRWALFEQAPGWPRVAEPFASRGHATGQYTIEIRVSPESRDAYVSLVPDSKLEDGAVVVAYHHDVRSGRAGPIYVMEKKSGAWTFRSLDPTGMPAGDGLSELCVRCHSESRSDELFGLPAALRPGPDPQMHEDPAGPGLPSSSKLQKP